MKKPTTFFFGFLALSLILYAQVKEKPKPNKPTSQEIAELNAKSLAEKQKADSLFFATLEQGIELVEPEIEKTKEQKVQSAVNNAKAVVNLERKLEAQGRKIEAMQDSLQAKPTVVERHFIQQECDTVSIQNLKKCKLINL